MQHSYESDLSHAHAQSDSYYTPSFPSAYQLSSHPEAIQQSVVQLPSTRPSITPHSSYLQAQPAGPSVQPSLSGPPPQSPVAPLDISTTLEGSLVGMRESIVTVSAAVDSLSRRQEVALTAESMRTTEEIRSLRAVIHGLRLQVRTNLVFPPGVRVSLICGSNSGALDNDGSECPGYGTDDRRCHVAHLAS